MIDALIAGRVRGKPAERTAKNGSRYATAAVRVSLRDGSTIFASVIAFSATAITALLALEDGDSVAIAGELTPKVGTDREGKAKVQLDVLGHAVLSEYHVQRKRQAVKGSDSAQRTSAAEVDFNDEIPF